MIFNVKIQTFWPYLFVENKKSAAITLIAALLGVDEGLLFYVNLSARGFRFSRFLSYNNV